jgi:hypothetical protein
VCVCVCTSVPRLRERAERISTRLPPISPYTHTHIHTHTSSSSNTTHMAFPQLTPTEREEYVSRLETILYENIYPFWVQDSVIDRVNGRYVHACIYVCNYIIYICIASIAVHFSLTYTHTHTHTNTHTHTGGFNLNHDINGVFLGPAPKASTHTHTHTYVHTHIVIGSPHRLIHTYTHTHTHTHR